MIRIKGFRCYSASQSLFKVETLYIFSKVFGLEKLPRMDDVKFKATPSSRALFWIFLDWKPLPDGPVIAIILSVVGTRPAELQKGIHISHVTNTLTTSVTTRHNRASGSAQWMLEINTLFLGKCSWPHDNMLACRFRIVRYLASRIFHDIQGHSLKLNQTSDSNCTTLLNLILDFDIINGNMTSLKHSVWFREETFISSWG